MRRKTTNLKMFNLLLALVMVAFFAVACDVDTGSGNEGCGVVTDPDPGPTPDPDPTPDPEPTPDPDPTPDPEPTPDPDPAPPSACRVDYVMNQWNTGFTAEVTIANNGRQAINGWELAWTFANGQQMSGSWNADVVQTGNRVKAANPAGHWNGTLAQSGGRASFGFQATHSGTNAVPLDFSLNGVACNGGPAPDPDPTPDPDPDPTPDPSAPATFRVNEAGNITKNGNEIPINCGAWFGLEGQYEPHYSENNPGGAPMELYVGNMWWDNTGRTIQQTMTEIKQLGINVVRLPIAPQTLDPNDPQGIGDIRQGGVLKNHESVRQTNARQALENFITLAARNDIEVIVDIHSCSNYVGWRAGRLDAAPPYVDATRDNYEFTREDHHCLNYGEARWLDDLRDIASLPQKLGVNNLLAIDIFNEPWDYTWAEWKRLAENAFAVIDAVNPDVLIMVEGVGSAKADGTQVPHGDPAFNPNWGENFFGARTDPLNIPKERLIISPHTYGPSVFVQRHFMDPSQPHCAELEGDAAGDAKCNIVIDPAKLRKGWQEHFGFLRDQGYAVLIGEFGGHLNWPQETSEQRDRDRWGYITASPDRLWQNALVDYMIEKDMDACYWSINPESGDTGGLYRHAYDPISKQGWGRWLGFDAEKVELLQRLWDK